jgi:hypothetical protein
MLSVEAFHYTSYWQLAALSRIRLERHRDEPTGKTMIIATDVILERGGGRFICNGVFAFNLSRWGNIPEPVSTEKDRGATQRGECMKG